MRNNLCNVTLYMYLFVDELKSTSYSITCGFPKPWTYVPVQLSKPKIMKVKIKKMILAFGDIKLELWVQWQN